MRSPAVLRRGGSTVFHLIGLDDIPRALVPLLVVDMLGSVAFSNFFIYVAIWAKERLHATDHELGLAFLLSAFAAAAAGSIGGVVSDRVGRKPLIVVGWGASITASLAALAAGDNTLVGLTAFVVISGLAAIGHGADTALVADLVPPEARERSFAAVRLTGNLGGVLGPSIGALALVLYGWNGLFITAAALGIAATAIGIRYLPATGDYTPPRSERIRGAWRVLLTDVRYGVFWCVSVLQYVIYTMYETLLPISLTQSYGYSAASWGLLAGINPLLVVLFQLRITRASSRYPRVGLRLAIATLLMGLPFLLLEVSSALPVVILIIVVFVIGEMLWVPTGQAVAERMAPDSMRGAYLGAFTATSGVAFALGPLAGLQIRAAGGTGAVWYVVAVIAVIASLITLAVVRGMPGRPASPFAHST